MNGDEPGSGSAQGSRWRARLLFAALLAAVSFLLAWQVVPEVLDGRLAETDSYMRAVRVQHLLESGKWYDQAIPGSNAPFGEVSHWTRPLDLLLLGVMGPLRLFRTGPESLHLSAVFLPPLLLLLLCFATAWAILPLAGRRVQTYVMIAALAQPAIVGYGLPGRPDHHILMFLLFAVVVGSGIRWFDSPAFRRWSLVAGLATAAGIWVGPEFLFIWGLLLASVFLLWLLRGADFAAGASWYSMGVLGGLLVALVLEHPPTDWLQPEYDRISAPHVLAAFLALIFWRCLAWLEARRPPGIVLEKLGVAAIGLATAALAMVLAYPGFFAGPAATVDPRLSTIWFNLLEERVSLIPPDGLAGWGNVLVYLGSPLIGLAAASWFSWRSRKTEESAPWLFLLFFLLAMLLASSARIRFAPYPEILGAMTIGVILWKLVHRLDRLPSELQRSSLRLGSAVLLITGPLFLGFALTAAGGQSGAEIRGAARVAAQSCPVSNVIGWLADEENVPGPPRTIAAHLDYGPEILYRTPHRVLGTPYHRNAEGILATFAVLADPDLAVSRQIVEERRVDLVLVCPLDNWIYGGGLQGHPEGSTLHALLASGQVPDWLEPMPLPEGQSGDVLLFRVR